MERPERTISALLKDSGDVDSTRPLIMGVLNVTPDSFSDGGLYVNHDDALRHAEVMVSEGADVLDIGGESSRPGASGTPVQQELDRVIPVIESIRSRVDVTLSIDTVKPEVMREALRVGARMINDINALRSDGALDLVARAGVPVCLMHMQGTPGDMQERPEYEDVVEEVYVFLQQRARDCIAAGIDADNIIVDPGFGFGKTAVHNLQLLDGIERFTDLGFSVLAGLSRKSMIGKIFRGSVSGIYASVALAVMAYSGGARILRVHDVAATVEAIAMCRAVLKSETAC